MTASIFRNETFMVRVEPLSTFKTQDHDGHDVIIRGIPGGFTYRRGDSFETVTTENPRIIRLSRDRYVIPIGESKFSY